MTVGGSRGRLFEYAPGMSMLVTVHPSYLLRVPDADKRAEYRRFVADLRLARSKVA
jgi:DNA polymerase